MLELKCVMMSVEVRLDCSQTGVWSGKKLSAGGGLLVQRSVKRAEHALSFMQVVHQGHGSCLDICQKETLVIHYSLFR